MYTLNDLNDTTMRYCNHNYIPKNPGDIELLVTLTFQEYKELIENIHDLPSRINTGALKDLPVDIIATIRTTWGPVAYIKIVPDTEIPLVENYEKYMEKPCYIYDIETGEQIRTTQQMKHLLLTNWIPVRKQLRNPPKRSITA